METLVYLESKIHSSFGDYSYLHVNIRIFTDSCGNDDLYNGLVIHGQADNQDPMRIYHWSLDRSCFFGDHLTHKEIMLAAKAMKKIKSYLAKCEKKYGRVTDYATYAMRVLACMKIDRIESRIPNQYQDPKHPIDVSDISNEVYRACKAFEKGLNLSESNAA